MNKCSIFNNQMLRRLRFPSLEGKPRIFGESKGHGVKLKEQHVVVTSKPWPRRL